MEELLCKRCDHKWYKRILAIPRKCPRCGSPHWDEEKRNGGSKIRKTDSTA
jgi:predicted Zn-ribbon and HTH transcriptional regulator